MNTKFFCLGFGLSVCFMVVIFSSAAHADDGVILINQTNALAGGITDLDAPGFPVTISQPGSYRLSSNLDLGRSPNPNGIEITANDVTLDLNGFRIFGNARQGVGILANPVTTLTGITIRNGTVSNFSNAIRLDESTQNLVEQIAAHDNGFGITVGANSIVRGNRVFRSTIPGPFALSVGINSIVTGNIVSENAGAGIAVGDERGIIGNSTVSGNTASRNGGTGILVGANSTVSGNTASENMFDSSSFSGMLIICPGSVVGNTAGGNSGGNNIQTDGLGGVCTRANNDPMP